MPRLTNSLPKYRKHKASGQAFVELNLKRFYLGPHGTKTSKTEYDRLIAAWLANGRSLPGPSKQALSVSQLVRRIPSDRRAGCSISTLDGLLSMSFVGTA